jgi:hypothetical protein
MLRAGQPDFKRSTDCEHPATVGAAELSPHERKAALLRRSDTEAVREAEKIGVLREGHAGRCRLERKIRRDVPICREDSDVRSYIDWWYRLQPNLHWAILRHDLEIRMRDSVDDVARGDEPLSVMSSDRECSPEPARYVESDCSRVALGRDHGRAR